MVTKFLNTRTLTLNIRLSNYKWDSVKISLKMFILEIDFLVNSDLPVNMYGHTLSDNMTDLSNRNGK